MYNLIHNFIYRSENGPEQRRHFPLPGLLRNNLRNKEKISKTKYLSVSFAVFESIYNINIYDIDYS